MGIKLRLREPLYTWLDLSPFSPLADTSAGDVSGPADEAASVLLSYGRRAVRADALFAVSACDAPGLCFFGDLTLGLGLGQRLGTGCIRAEGNVGPYLGRGMTGGEIWACGNAGENAFDGMQNGFGVLSGAALDGACRRMRRGTVVLGGAGGALGEEMRGGTLLVQGLLPQGAAGGPTRVGRGMDRGTILLPAGASVPEGFSAAAALPLPFLRFLYRQLAARGINVPATDGDGTYIRCRGDAQALGKGEVFLPAEQSR